MRILSVKGVGQVSKIPDLMVVNFEIMSQSYDYDKAMNELNKRTNILKQDIMKANFSKEDLKTTDYSIDTDYKYENNEKIFLGYKAIHQLRLEFDYKQEVLNQLINIVSKSDAEPVYRLSFEVKDKQSFKDEVLTDAVLNAKQSASVIAKSAGIKLGKILNINYNVPEIMIRSSLVLENQMLEASQVSITPEEIKETDSITIEYEIEDLM